MFISSMNLLCLSSLTLVIVVQIVLFSYLSVPVYCFINLAFYGYHQPRSVILLVFRMFLHFSSSKFKILSSV